MSYITKHIISFKSISVPPNILSPKRIDPGQQQEGERSRKKRLPPTHSGSVDHDVFFFFFCPASTARAATLEGKTSLALSKLMHSLPFPSPFALARPQSMTVSMSSMVMAVSAMFVLKTIFLT